ncbi:MAG: hypothetical protein RSE10_01725 [Oscillospiraceae bacterium]
MNNHDYFMGKIEDAQFFTKAFLSRQVKEIYDGLCDVKAKCEERE